MRNLDVVIREDLKELCDQPFEYVLYGKVAPNTTRIVIITVACVVYAIFALFILPCSWYLIPLTLFVAFLAYHFFYDKAYLAKFGKHLYIHRFRPFKPGVKEAVVLRNVAIDESRSGNFHTGITVTLEEETQCIILETKFAKKGIDQQATNMKRLEADIAKKKRK